MSTALDVVEAIWRGEKSEDEIAAMLESYVDSRIARARTERALPHHGSPVGDLKLTQCPGCGQTVAKAVGT